MDVKKIAMILAITVLLPLFVGLFTDAVYKEPTYEKYCNDTRYYYDKTMPATSVNCTQSYDVQINNCYRESGSPEFNYTADGCQIYDSCNYCNKLLNDAQQKYNRNIFFILLPLGLAVVILGLYLLVDYLGAGLMFAGLIIMFYATMRYFSDMSKILRAVVILIELLVIMWIGYKKISEEHDNRANSLVAKTKKKVVKKTK
jgi:hypothetical protein